ncbi:hypothetical protein [Burkholderia pyrrocinia]
MKHIPACAERGAAGAFALLRYEERLRIGARLPVPDALRHAMPASIRADARRLPSFIGTPYVDDFR